MIENRLLHLMQYNVSLFSFYGCLFLCPIWETFVNPPGSKDITLFSSWSLVVLWFTLKSKIHFLGVVWDRSHFLFLFSPMWIFGVSKTLVEKPFLSPLDFSDVSVGIKWLYKYDSISGLSFLICRYIYLFLCQNNSVLISVAL